MPISPAQNWMTKEWLKFRDSIPQEDEGAIAALAEIENDIEGVIERNPPTQEEEGFLEWIGEENLNKFLFIQAEQKPSLVPYVREHDKKQNDTLGGLFPEGWADFSRTITDQGASDRLYAMEQSWNDQVSLGRRQASDNGDLWGHVTRDTVLGPYYQAYLESAANASTHGV
jgi:hypothetical protein